MKKLLKRIWPAVLFVVLFGGGFTMAEITDRNAQTTKPSEIDCTCGCGQKAVKCGDHCSIARELLKKYKGV